MQYHIEQIDGRLTGFIMSYYVSYNFYVSDREDTVFVEHANRPIAYTICEYSLLSVNKTTLMMVTNYRVSMGKNQRRLSKVRCFLVTWFAHPVSQCQ